MALVTVLFTTNKSDKPFKTTFCCADPTDHDLIRRTILQDIFLADPRSQAMKGMIDPNMITINDVKPSSDDRFCGWIEQVK